MLNEKYQGSKKREDHPIKILRSDIFWDASFTQLASGKWVRFSNLVVWIGIPIKWFSRHPGETRLPRYSIILSPQLVGGASATITGWVVVYTMATAIKWIWWLPKSLRRRNGWGNHHQCYPMKIWLGFLGFKCHLIKSQCLPSFSGVSLCRCVFVWQVIKLSGDTNPPSASKHSTNSTLIYLSRE